VEVSGLAAFQLHFPCEKIPEHRLVGGRQKHSGLLRWPGRAVLGDVAATLPASACAVSFVFTPATPINRRPNSSYYN